MMFSKQVEKELRKEVDEDNDSGSSEEEETSEESEEEAERDRPESPYRALTLPGGESAYACKSFHSHKSSESKSTKLDSEEEEQSMMTQH